MAQEIGIGVIGMGWMGTAHSRSYRLVNDRFHDSGVRARLVICADDVAHRAEEARSSLGFAESTTDWHEVVDHPDVQVVNIAAPNFLHKEMVEAVTSAGKHVFCEKPMALTVEDCDAMIEAADNAGVFLMIGYVRRFQNAYRKMKQLIDEGRIGEVRMAHTVRLGTGAPGGAEGWQLDRERYGGLFSMHSHELDQLTWMAGDVRAVQAAMRYGDESDNTVEESIFINLEFCSGAIGSLSSSRIYPSGSYELGVAGTEGSVKITSGMGAQLTLNRVGEKPEHMSFERNNGLLEEMNYFLQCIRTGEQPQSNGLDGRRTIAISLAAHESARTGEKVEVPRYI